MNFYITDAGYFPSSTDTEILWVFNNESETLYQSNVFTTSKDSKTIFLESFNNLTTSNFINKLEFIEKLKAAKYVDVRVKNDYGYNDIKFSLNGSTKSIDYVISKKYKDAQELYNNELKRIAEANIQAKIESRSKLYELFINYGISDEDERSNLYDKIESKFDSYDLNLNEIDSLDVIIEKYNSSINLYNSNGELIKSIEYIKSYIPNYISNTKKIKHQAKVSHLDSMLEVFPLEADEKLALKTKILSISEYRLNLENLDSIGLETKIEDATLTLYDDSKDKLYELKYIKNIIPKYISNSWSDIKINAVNRIKLLLEKYQLTENQLTIVLEETKDINLYKIEKDDANRVLIEVQPYDVTTINFFNDNLEVHQISIYDRKFAKEMKKKIKKLKL